MLKFLDAIAEHCWWLIILIGALLALSEVAFIQYSQAQEEERCWTICDQRGLVPTRKRHRSREHEGVCSCVSPLIPTGAVRGDE